MTFVVVMLGATLPTPMYPLYQRELGFSPIVQTVIFAVYALGVGAALLLLGRWSDQLGRRPLLLVGIAFSLVSSIVFVLAGPVWVLLVGRVLSGVSAGIFAGSATAAIVDAAPEAWRARASPVATAANVGGLGLGPLLAGLAVEYLPAPLHLSYAVHAVLVAACTLLVWMVPETVQRAERPILRPQTLRVPPEVRGVFVSASTAGFSGFAVLGLFAAISPKIVSDTLGIPNHAIAGLMVFLLLAASVIAQLVEHRYDSGRMLLLGAGLLVVGTLVVALAVVLTSTAVFVVGVLIAGAGQGSTLSNGLATVNRQVNPDERAAVTSSYFVVLYVALTLPVIGVGAATQGWGIATASIVFCVAVAVLAAAALVALLVLRRRGVSAPAGSARAGTRSAP